ATGAARSTTKVVTASTTTPMDSTMTVSRTSMKSHVSVMPNRPTVSARMSASRDAIMNSRLRTVAHCRSLPRTTSMAIASTIPAMPLSTNITPRVPPTPDDEEEVDPAGGEEQDGADDAQNPQ